MRRFFTARNKVLLMRPLRDCRHSRRVEFAAYTHIHRELAAVSLLAPLLQRGHVERREAQPFPLITPASSLVLRVTGQARNPPRQVRHDEEKKKKKTNAAARCRQDKLEYGFNGARLNAVVAGGLLNMQSVRGRQYTLLAK